MWKKIWKEQNEIMENMHWKYFDNIYKNRFLTSKIRNVDMNTINTYERGKLKYNSQVFWNSG